MNIFKALDATIRKSFDFVSANFLGPGHWSVQHNNGKTRIQPFIQCIEENVLSHLETGLKKIAVTSYNIAISLSFDGTKVPKTLSPSTTFQAIVGGAVPNHFLSIDRQSEDWVKSILHPNSTIKWADEIKWLYFPFNARRRRKHVSLLWLADQSKSMQIHLSMTWS